MIIPVWPLYAAQVLLGMILATLFLAVGIIIGYALQRGENHDIT